MMKKLGNIIGTKYSFDSGSFKRSGKSYASKGYKGDFDFLHLIKSWPKIVGPMLAKRSRPLKISSRKLIIITADSLLPAALRFVEERIKNQIYQHYPLLRTQFNKLYVVVNVTQFEELSRRPQALVRDKGLSEEEQKKILYEKKVKRELFNLTHPSNPEYRELQIEAQKKFAYMDDQSKLQKLCIDIYIFQVLNSKIRQRVPKT